MRRVTDEDLNFLVGSVALVVMWSIVLCVWLGILETLLQNNQYLILLGCLTLTSGLGWYAVYGAWKRYFRRKSLANVQLIIRLVGYAILVTFAGFCTFLLFLFVYFAVTFGIQL